MRASERINGEVIGHRFSDLVPMNCRLVKIQSLLGHSAGSGFVTRYRSCFLGLLMSVGAHHRLPARDTNLRYQSAPIIADCHSHPESHTAFLSI